MVSEGAVIEDEGVVTFRKQPFNINEEETKFIVVKSYGTAIYKKDKVIGQNELDELLLNRRYKITVKY